MGDDSNESFLPQIVGLFYAIFDQKLGPTVTHQVPENLITPLSSPAAADESRSRSVSRTRFSPSPSRPRSPSCSRSPARSAPTSPSPSSHAPPVPPAQPAAGAALLEFAPISDYVIPKKPLTGKLVTVLTTGDDDGRRAEYRIMGVPCVLDGEGGKYVRNEYMWNLCFVFEAKSRLDSFEPVVRKCARILRSAELDSAYLSAPSADHTPLGSVLEQLFEDLNSYSETSVPLDGFNSLELKLFPFYPNPSECEDWHVPVALADFTDLKDDNWDITAARVSQYIDGVNHVRRIAELADADPALTRETLKHMLYYQVVMMIDIFQYSNIYTLKPSITRLASDESIISECATYVIRRDYPKLSWPTLLGLYSKLQPGTTVHQWMENNNILDMGIDPRRFVSFGIIKGFLRRVHRWPIQIERKSPLIGYPEHGKRRVEFDRRAAQAGSATTLSTRPGDSGLTRSGAGDSTWTLHSTESHASVGLGISPGSVPTKTPPSVTRSPAKKPAPFTGVRDSYPRSLGSAADTHPSTGSRRTQNLRSGALRIREAENRAMEEELTRYLDGMHHADEIQVRFGISWDKLEVLLGVRDVLGGKGPKGVAVIYR